MFKSVFSKYFTVTAAVIFLSFVLLAGTQTLFARRYWLRDKEVLLNDHAANIAGFVSENSLELLPGEYVIPSTLTPTIKWLAESFDGNAIITDTSFKVLLCSESVPCAHIGETLPATLHAALQNNSLFTVSRVGNFYDEAKYCSGATLYKGNTVIGYVLVTTSAAELLDYIVDNIQIFLVSALAILIIAFVILYLMTYRFVRPLRQMATATRRFSQGDFSYRVKVHGKDEIAELATALNGMAVSLSSVEEMRRSFVGNVSHELRTPMTTISGFIDGILDGTIPPERQKEYLKIVSDETKRLSRLVRSMLDLSRIDSGQLKLTPASFDLTAVACNTLVLFEQRIEDKEIQIEGIDTCSPQYITADYDLMQQVVYNLVDNAVKFTEQGGRIRLLIFRKENRTYCMIRNTGMGIPAAELPHIFDRFYKSDRSRGLDKSGTGLGLYIVKTLIDLHGGEITVSSREHEYCEFAFWLPDSQKNA
ncbi:MAG: HAMP domain-containing histidine kinase [Clostridia bacterium]|nr:HAMP domain-containing histidine kinase [Clostridia bacterium]